MPEQYLEEVKEQLDEIQGTIYGGMASMGDLNQILGVLNRLEYDLKQNKELMMEEHKLWNQNQKLIQLFVRILSIFFIVSTIAGFFSIPFGVIFFLVANYLASEMKKAIKNDHRIELLNKKATELLEDMAYKKGITKKKIEILKREDQKVFSSQDQIPTLPKIKMVRIREL